MSDFAKQFLLEDPRRLKAFQGRQVLLSAFGKHPGWADYFDVMELDGGTRTSYWAKTILHLEGFAKRPDATSDTERRQSGVTLPCDFVFLWKRSGQFLMGRFWPSHDASRRPYPMFICFHCVGLPLDWILSQLLPKLDGIQQSCHASGTEAEVRFVLERILGTVRSIVADLPAEPPLSQRLSPAREQFLSKAELGAQHHGLFSVLHQIRSDMGPFLGREADSKLEWADARARRVRLPHCAAHIGEAVLLWSEFLNLLLNPNIPQLFVVPQAQSWLDVTVGRPRNKDVWALLQPLTEVPIASSIPYELEETVKTRANEIIAAFRAGNQGPGFGTSLLTRKEASPAADPKMQPPPSTPRASKWSWLFGGANK